MTKALHMIDFDALIYDMIKQENHPRPQNILFYVQGQQVWVSVLDAPKVLRIKWHLHTSCGRKKKLGAPYVRGTVNGKKVLLHRFIMDAPSDKHVDHINHNTLDNRRENLRLMCPKENALRRRNRVS